MRSFLVALLVICIASAEVQKLDDNNFEKLTQMGSGSTTGRWFVKFYAPWCGHCKKLAPVWEELSEVVGGELNVAEVDATANPVLAKLYNIEGFPTLLYFVDGKYTSYEGPRTLEALKEFAFEDYKDEDYTPCPKFPSLIDKKIETYSRMAGKYLAEQPFTTCFVLMGCGAAIGFIFTMIFCCCCNRPRYEPVTEEKKNN